MVYLIWLSILLIGCAVLGWSAVRVVDIYDGEDNEDSGVH